MKKIFLTMALAVGLMATAQVKIGANPTNINAASLLELENSPTTKQGLLLPRVALSNTTTPTLDGGLNVEGMTVYNTATAGDVTPGLYTNDGSKWVKVGAATVAPLNVTAEQLGNYIALATDDIILMTPAAANTLTLPTTGIAIGKKLYVSIMGTAGTITPSPTVRESSAAFLNPTFGYIFIYVGGTGAGSWSMVSGF